MIQLLSTFAGAPLDHKLYCWTLLGTFSPHVWTELYLVPPAHTRRINCALVSPVTHVYLSYMARILILSIFQFKFSTCDDRIWEKNDQSPRIVPISSRKRYQRKTNFVTYVPSTFLRRRHIHREYRTIRGNVYPKCKWRVSSCPVRGRNVKRNVNSRQSRHKVIVTRNIISLVDLFVGHAIICFHLITHW